MGVDDRNRRKVIRSFSIDERTMERLNSVAKNRKISVNALLQDIIDYYIEIGAHSGDIGLIQIASPYFHFILETCDVKRLIEMATRVSPGAWQEWVELRGLQSNIPSFLNMVKYHEGAGWANITIAEEVSGGKKIIFTHSLGENWSKFLEAWFKGGYLQVTGKALPEDAFKIISTGLSMTL